MKAGIIVQFLRRPMAEHLGISVTYLNTLHAIPLLAMAVAILLVPGGANATPICRWVDETGRTQVAGAVPDLYAAVATCTDSQKYELSPQQRKAAEQGAEVDKAKARSEAARLPAPSASGTPRPSAPQPPSITKRPAEFVTEATSCPTWWRLYDESGECFGPFRTVRGATKAEAFDVCNVVLSPEPKCGPRSN